VNARQVRLAYGIVMTGLYVAVMVTAFLRHAPGWVGAADGGIYFLYMMLTIATS
jgi:hypothetical protein